jgi:hypothetical protein
VEKWESKNRIPTFPQPRQPAAARKKSLTKNTKAVSDGPKTGTLPPK